MWRRIGTADEYSLHKGLRGAERSFKLPNNSGPVGAVRAMPNDYYRIIYVDELLWYTSFLFTLMLTLWDTIIQRALQMRLKGLRRPCVV